MKFLLLLFGFCCFCFSQSKTFEIVYKLKSNVDQNTTFELLLKAEQEIDKVEPTIIFNDSVAVYKSNFKATTIGEKLALNFFCGCNVSKFYDLKNFKVYYYTSNSMFFKSKEYLIEDDYKNNWVLTSESKLIDDKLCFKATQFLTDNKKYKENVTAWYCPELPYNIGPNGFGGLPGLILELHAMNNVFGLKSLKQIKSDELKNFPKLEKIIKKVNFDLLWNEKQKEVEGELEKNKVFQNK